MELGSRIRWGAVVIAVLVLLVGAIIGVSAIARGIFKSNDSSSGQTEEEALLSEYNRPGVNVILEVQGPVVAKEKYNTYRLIVSRTARTMQVIRGYDNSVVKEERLDNTEASFDVFLKSLERAGFDRLSGKFKDQDEKGVCANGRRYIFEIEDDGVEAFRAWKTSCAKESGSSAAPTAVRTLFQKQFPNFANFTAGLNL